MKKRHIIPLLGLLGSTALSAALVIYVIAQPLSRLTGISESTLNWCGLLVLCILNLCRIFLILNDRDRPTNLITAPTKANIRSKNS